MTFSRPVFKAESLPDSAATPSSSSNPTIKNENADSLPSWMLAPSMREPDSVLPSLIPLETDVFQDIPPVSPMMPPEIHSQSKMELDRVHSAQMSRKKQFIQLSHQLDGQRVSIPAPAILLPNVIEEDGLTEVWNGPRWTDAEKEGYYPQRPLPAPGMENQFETWKGEFIPTLSFFIDEFIRNDEVKSEQRRRMEQKRKQKEKEHSHHRNNGLESGFSVKNESSDVSSHFDAASALDRLGLTCAEDPNEPDPLDDLSMAEFESEILNVDHSSVPCILPDSATMSVQCANSAVPRPDGSAIPADASVRGSDNYSISITGDIFAVNLCQPWARCVVRGLTNVFPHPMPFTLEDSNPLKPRKTKIKAFEVGERSNGHWFAVRVPSLSASTQVIPPKTSASIPGHPAREFNATAMSDARVSISSQSDWIRDRLVPDLPIFHDCLDTCQCVVGFVFVSRSVMDLSHLRGCVKRQWINTLRTLGFVNDDPSSLMSDEDDDDSEKHWHYWIVERAFWLDQPVCVPTSLGSVNPTRLYNINDKNPAQAGKLSVILLNYLKADMEGSQRKKANENRRVISSEEREKILECKLKSDKKIEGWDQILDSIDIDNVVITQSVNHHHKFTDDHHHSAVMVDSDEKSEQMMDEEMDRSHRSSDLLTPIHCVNALIQSGVSLSDWREVNLVPGMNYGHSRHRRKMEGHLSLMNEESSMKRENPFAAMFEDINTSSQMNTNQNHQKNNDISTNIDHHSFVKSEAFYSDSDADFECDEDESVVLDLEEDEQHNRSELIVKPQISGIDDCKAQEQSDLLLLSEEQLHESSDLQQWDHNDVSMGIDEELFRELDELAMEQRNWSNHMNLDMEKEKNEHEHDDDHHSTSLSDRIPIKKECSDQLAVPVFDSSLLSRKSEMMNGMKNENEEWSLEDTHVLDSPSPEQRSFNGLNSEDQRRYLRQAVWDFLDSLKHSEKLATRKKQIRKVVADMLQINDIKPWKHEIDEIAKEYVSQYQNQ